MIISEVKDRNESLINELVDVWERSVKATHLFLSAAEIAQIKNYVPQALGGVAHLMLARLTASLLPLWALKKIKLKCCLSHPNSAAKGLAGSLLNTPLQNLT